MNYRDYHAMTRGDGWCMDIAAVRHGLRVIAYGGARPLLLLADRGDARIAHTWYRGFDLPRERERGLDAAEDHLHAATFQASLEPGQTLTLVLSTEPTPSLGGERAWAVAPVTTRRFMPPGAAPSRRPSARRPGSASWCGTWTSSSHGVRSPTIPTA